MGIIRTDKWLEDSFYDTQTICAKLKHEFGEDHPRNIYQYLLGFGMYKPNRNTYACFEELKKTKAWDEVDRLFHLYRKKWQGPDIPIYLFPIHSGGFLSKGRQSSKSGVSFKDKMFLFIDPLEDEKELEALIIHEYHHICRMNKLNKDVKAYTLLDSIVMEGLAENTVAEICGEQYLANWCTHYTKKELLSVWEKSVKGNLDRKKTSSIHDEILFGLKRFPTMIGYAIGYERVLNYKMNHSLTIKNSFQLPSKKFIGEDG